MMIEVHIKKLIKIIDLKIAATQCILQNMTKEKAVRTLTPYLANVTPRFVDSLFKSVENYDESFDEERKCKSFLKFKSKSFM